MVPYPILTAVLQTAAFKPGYYQQGDCRRLYSPPQPLPPPPSSTVQYYYFIKTNFFYSYSGNLVLFSEEYFNSEQVNNDRCYAKDLLRVWTIIGSEHFKSRQKDLTVQMGSYFPSCFDGKRSKKTKNLWNRSSFSFLLNNISRDLRFRFWNRDNCSENFLKNQP